MSASDDGALRKRPRNDDAGPVVPEDLKSMAMRAMVSEAFDQDADKCLDNLFHNASIRQAAEERLLKRAHPLPQIASSDPVQIVYNKVWNSVGGDGIRVTKFRTTVFNLQLGKLPYPFVAVFKSEYLQAMNMYNTNPEMTSSYLTYDARSNVLTVNFSYCLDLPDWFSGHYTSIVHEVDVVDAVQKYNADHIDEDEVWDLEVDDCPFAQDSVEEDAWTLNFARDGGESFNSRLDSAWNDLWKLARRLDKKSKRLSEAYANRAATDTVHMRRPRIRIELLDDEGWAQ